MSLMEGDLSHVALPADLEILRDTAGAALSRGASLDALYDALAAEHPVALVDLVMGPRALAGDAAVRAALRVLDALESTTRPAPLFRRLVELGASDEVLALAVARHPDGDWLESVARRLEDGPCRLVALHIAAGHETAALELAARTLEEQPDAPFVPWLAAACGPECEPFFRKLVPRLRSKDAARALRGQLQLFPNAQALLTLVLPGMV